VRAWGTGSVEALALASGWRPGSLRRGWCMELVLERASASRLDQASRLDPELVLVWDSSSPNRASRLGSVADPGGGRSSACH
jgi:hypothetical protein